MTPHRIQRKRTRGWRMPLDAVFVGRPTAWGNPFKEGGKHPVHGWPMSRQEAVELYEKHLYSTPGETGFALSEEARTYLRGKNLVCWCALDQPCHGDVLLAISNQ